jgi:DNA-binding GntR family transcriptional regulator
VTPNQKAVLDAIAHLTERHGIAPSHREIGRHTGIGVGHVNEIIGRLAEAGLVTFEPQRARTVPVIAPSEAYSVRAFRRMPTDLLSDVASAANAVLRERAA